MYYIHSLYEFTTRNSSGDEIANMTFLYDEIVHALQNRPTINWCINSATDRRGYVIERRFTKFSEITQCNGHYTVQGHSSSPISVVKLLLIFGQIFPSEREVPHFSALAGVITANIAINDISLKTTLCPKKGSIKLFMITLLNF